MYIYFVNLAQFEKLRTKCTHNPFFKLSEFEKLKINAYKFEIN